MTTKMMRMVVVVVVMVLGLALSLKDGKKVDLVSHL